MDRSELKRQSAHILLDAISVLDDTTSPDPEPAVKLALRRLDDIEAVTSTYDEDADARRVDVLPVLHPAIALLNAAVTGYAAARNIEVVEAIGMLRTTMDMTYGETD